MTVTLYMIDVKTCNALAGFDIRQVGMPHPTVAEIIREACNQY